MARRNKNAKPVRKCIGCNTSKNQDELLRISYYENEIKVDLDGKAKGRGTYICKDEECLKKAKTRKSFIRAYGVDIPEGEEKKLIKIIRLGENEQS